VDVPERQEALRVLHRAGALTERVNLVRYAVAAIYRTRQRIPPEMAEDPTVRLFFLGDYAGALPRFAAEAAEAHARGQLAREAYCHGLLARCHIALGQLKAGRAALAEAHAVELLSTVLPALQRAAPSPLSYLRTACDAAETLWLLDRDDHLPVVEAALRDKALPADFRLPMVDARLALARLCALDGRDTEASRWFAEARVVLDAQGARPLRAIVDFNEAQMYTRAARPDAARPLLDAAVDQFTRLGMSGWLRRAGAVGVER
jgi:hypothetical protein